MFRSSWRSYQGRSREWQWGHPRGQRRSRRQSGGRRRLWRRQNELSWPGASGGRSHGHRWQHGIQSTIIQSPQVIKGSSMKRTIWSNNNDGSVRQRVCFWKGCEYASKNKDPSTVFSHKILLLHWHTIAVLEMIFPKLSITMRQWLRKYEWFPKSIELLSIGLWMIRECSMPAMETHICQTGCQGSPTPPSLDQAPVIMNLSTPRLRPSPRHLPLHLTMEAEVLTPSSASPLTPWLEVGWILLTQMASVASEEIRWEALHQTMWGCHQPRWWPRLPTTPLTCSPRGCSSKVTCPRSINWTMEDSLGSPTPPQPTPPP